MSLRTAVTVGTIGLACKAFLNLGFCSSVRVSGLHHLLDALEDNKKRDKGIGIITASNHISVLDEPLTWGILPWSYYFQPRKTRWVLGASEIMFTNPSVSLSPQAPPSNTPSSVFSSFFRAGQVLETFRGRGIYQESVDKAIELLDRGEWIHLFPESKVCQRSTDKPQSLAPFKWGIARMLLESTHPPTVIPMYLTGFDKIMPEHRSFPKFLPRLRKDISIAIGSPTRLETAIRGVLEKRAKDDVEMRKVLTGVVHREVEALGKGVVGIE